MPSIASQKGMNRYYFLTENNVTITNLIEQGVSLKCTVPDTKSLVDCSSDIPNGGEAYYQCQRNFINAFGDQGGSKVICNSQGRWLKMAEYQDFTCVPGKL
jgi:hypothetical protein